MNEWRKRWLRLKKITAMYERRQIWEAPQRKNYVEQSQEKSEGKHLGWCPCLGIINPIRLILSNQINFNLVRECEEACLEGQDNESRLRNVKDEMPVRCSRGGSSKSRHEVCSSRERLRGMWKEQHTGPVEAVEKIPKGESQRLSHRKSSV